MLAVRNNSSKNKRLANDDKISVMKEDYEYKL